jgi:hypothetical protein
MAEMFYAGNWFLLFSALVVIMIAASLAVSFS